MSDRITLFGRVPEDWTISEIGNIAQLRQGLQISKKLRVDKDTKNSIPLLKITDLPTGVFSEYVKDIPENYLANEKDIIYTRTGQVGLVYTNVNGCVHNNCFKVIVDYTKFDKNYIYYYLKSNNVYKYANSVAGGSVQKDLTHTAFKKCKIAFPNLQKQKYIGNILYNLDKKIEINNKINDNLEKIAQAIFKQWFVDFEFPNKNGEPYKSSGGEMIESELGMIPKGWKVNEIYKIANVIYGAPFSSKKFNEDKIGLPLIRIRDLKTSMPSFYTEENHKKATKVKTGDILVGMDAEFTPTIWMGTEGYLNQRVCMFKPNKEYIHNYFLYEIIKPYMELMQFSKVGTTVIHLGKGDIDNMKVIIPNSNILELFYCLINPIYEKMIDIANEKRALINLRDSLLPKLMSGEIRVPLEEN